MQQELNAQHPELAIQILAVNAFGHESALSLMAGGGDIPLLQDVDADQDGLGDVWVNGWAVQWRDVVILNAQNEKVGVFNLTTNDLGNPAHFDQLQQMLVEAVAPATESPWQNPDNPLDVNDDQIVTPFDALLVINYLNSTTGTALPAPPAAPPPFLDVNGDHAATPFDALLVINHLNAVHEAGEGELVGSAAPGTAASAPAALAAAGHDLLPGVPPDTAGADASAGNLHGAPGSADEPGDAVELLLIEEPPVADEPSRRSEEPLPQPLDELDLAWVADDLAQLAAS